MHAFKRYVEQVPLLRWLKQGVYWARIWGRDVVRYQTLRRLDPTYEAYWQARTLDGGQAHTRAAYEGEGGQDARALRMRPFQRARCELALPHIPNGSRVIDIGGGDGSVLEYLNRNIVLSHMAVAEISPEALKVVRARGMEAIELPLTEPEVLTTLPETDFFIFFEILEHLHEPEEFLKIAVARAEHGVFLSVPNTGFFVHRLRLLFGRFPLQWVLFPGEHIRFWTYRDMHWWLGELGFEHYILTAYEGVPVLNTFLPGLFGAGLFVYIPKQ